MRVGLWVYIVDLLNIALAFANTIALLWLGLTVLLNAERRTWGTWVAGSGMLLASFFLAGHAAVVSRLIGTFSHEMEFWWWVGWLPFVGSPYGWYVVIAWYTGVYHERLHQLWLAITTIWGALAVALLVFANPLPSYQEVLQRSPTAITTIGGIIPVVGLIYPVYSIICIVLSLVALHHPAASERFMGDLARQRARPWLVATSGVLLLISLVVGTAAFWFLYALQTGQLPQLSLDTLAVFITFDLFVSTLITLATLLMGRAVVSYEVFTGKVLPRRGLFRHWRNSLILAGGYGIVIALSMAVEIDQIYRLLLATVLMTVFFALVSWRSFVLHDRRIEQLRPFVASQRTYEQVLQPTSPLDVDAEKLLQALCEEIVGARSLALVPLGPLAPLLGTSFSHPPDQLQISGILLRNLEQTVTPQQLCVPLLTAKTDAPALAVPLWGDRGLVGMLLLSDRRDGGLYTEEVIAIARTAGERLIDTLASTELARRLMRLQRERLARSHVLDRHTRRVLHDDVLPQLHTAMLQLSATPTPANDTNTTEIVEQLSTVHHQIATLLHDLPPTAAPTVQRLGLLGALRQMLERELPNAFERVIWDITPATEQRARALPMLATEVLFYAAREVMRNAARYGRGSDSTRQLTLTIEACWEEDFVLTIADDGVGIDAHRHPSTEPTPGTGQGLALHSTMMAVVGGVLTVESAPDRFTRAVLLLPQAVLADQQSSAISPLEPAPTGTQELHQPTPAQPTTAS